MKSTRSTHDIIECHGLIKTRVVLKSIETDAGIEIKIPINKNKSCIEIFLVPILQTDQRLINKNKSCIEILKYHTSLFAPLRLIKTRVVLKFQSNDLKI